LATIAVLTLAYLLSQFFRSFLAIVAEDLSRQLGFGPAELGNLSGIWFAVFALAQIPIGVALDRFGPRRTVGSIFLAAAVGCVVFASAQGFWLAALGMALIGLGCAPVFMGSLYLFGRIYPRERFALLTAGLVGVGSLGNLAGATPLALAAAAYGWRATFVAIGFATAAVAAAVLVLVRDPPPARDSDTGGGLSGYLELLRVPRLVLLLPIVTTGYAIVIAERSLWIGPFFQAVHGLDAIARANAAFAMALAMSLGAFAYGPVERVLGAKRTVIAGTLVTAAAFAGAAFAPGPASAAALLAAAGFFGMTYGTVMTHGQSFFPDRLLGRGVTGLNLFFIGGAAVLQAISGAFVERAGAAGWSADATFAALHLGFSALLVLSLVPYAFVPAKGARR
jgi:MFS family permease